MKYYKLQNNRVKEMRMISKAKTIKEIFLIILSTILLFGGFGLILTAEFVNGIIVLGAVMIAYGMAIFVYIIKGE